MNSSDKLHKAIDFIFYTITVIIIISISSINSLFLIAPPYAVTAYLIIFEHGGKYSKKKSVFVSYLFVIFSSELIHLMLGISPVYMTLLVIFVFVLIGPAVVMGLLARKKSLMKNFYLSGKGELAYWLSVMFVVSFGILAIL